MGTVNVEVLVPDSSVASMQDEIADNSVQTAVEAAQRAYASVATSSVQVVSYDEDFDNGLAVANDYADATEGPDVRVIISDLECNEPERAEQLLNDSDDVTVVVVVSNQGYDTAWAKRLNSMNNVHVVSVADLANPAIAMAKVGPFLEHVA